MKDITQSFGTVYRPIKALVVFNDDKKNTYVESYDMDENGCPVNAHPLTVGESVKLAKALDTSDALQRNFLKPAGLLPSNVLYINPDHNGFAVWHTPKQRVNLLFVERLKIPNGIASIPALLWKASKDNLYIYALADNTTVSEHTALYNAPFFNLYEDGKVCMGTVKINIPSDCLLEEFIALWQNYFFNSFFSHTLGGRSSVKGNIIQLWQSLIGKRKSFPAEVLLQKKLTVKQILL